MNDKVRNLLAPDVETQMRRNEKIRQYSCYFIIAITLILAMFVAPIIAGGITGDGWTYYLPKSIEGWIVFWAIRAGTLVGNLAVYILFKNQAKINSMKYPNYIEAEEILSKGIPTKEFIPQSPRKKLFKDYSIKGLLMVLFTVGESVVIGSLCIAFDLITFFSCITSSVSAVLFGWWAMIKDEMYWQDEYLRYAKYITTINKQEQDLVPEKESNENA